MRQPRQLKSVSNLIETSGTHLETLKFEASIRAERATKILELLSPNLSEYVQVGDLTLGLLTLYVPTAELASELRFKEFDLLHALEQDPLFSNLKRIQCRIRPIKKDPQTKKIKKRIYSKVAAGAILDYSKTLKDGNLKRQFQQLAELVSDNPGCDQR